MAVSVVIDYAQADLRQYDELVESLDLGGTAPAGSLFQWVAAKGDGFRIVDTWEDQAAFERFSADTLMPAAEAVGLEADPTIAFVPVHAYLPGA